MRGKDRRSAGRGRHVAAIAAAAAIGLLATACGGHAPSPSPGQVKAQASASASAERCAGRIISRCTSDVASLREVNVWGIDAMIINISRILMATGGMVLFAGWQLFFAVAWLGPVVYVFNRMYLTRAGVGFQLAREGFTRVSTNLAENIVGVRVVTAFNRQDPNLNEFNRLQDINTENNVAVARVNGVYQPLLEVIKFAGRVMILLYGGYLTATGRMGVSGVGAVVAVFLYWDWFMNPITTFELARTYAALGMLVEARDAYASIAKGYSQTLSALAEKLAGSVRAK